MLPATRMLPRRYWPAGATFILALIVYVRTLCPTVFVEGAGENVVAAWTLGVPHPPGFPLFCLLGKAFATLLPVGSVAYRINLFAAVMSAVAATLLYLLLTTAGLGRLASITSALAFAFSATFWRQATIAEVYTLSLTLIIAQFLLLLQWRNETAQAPSPSPPDLPSRKRRSRDQQKGPTRHSPPAADRWLLWFALAFGLGLTVHYGHALLLPAYLYFIIAHDRGVFVRWRTLGLAALLVFLGFSLHLYAPIRSLADPKLDWGNPETLANWWRYLTAEQYRGRMFHLPLSAVTGNLWTFARDLPHEFWWSGLIVAVGGALVLARRDRILLHTTALIFVIAVVWAVNYDIPWEIDVYYLPALLMAAIWIGFGVQWLVDRLTARRLPFVAVFVLAVPALALIVNFRANDLSSQAFVRSSGLDVLESVDDTSVLILPATNPTFALLYLTRVEGRAPGVELWSRLDRGIATVENAVHPPEQVELLPESRFVQDRIAQGQAVFAVDRQPAGGLPSLAQIPWGCVYRLVPEAEQEAWLKRAPDPLTRRFRLNLNDQRYRFGAEQRLIAGRYLLVMGDYAWATGDPETADARYQQALRVLEGTPSLAVQIGLRYADQGRLDQAAALYRQALATKDDAETRNRLGVIYGRRGKLVEAKAEFDRAIALKPELAEAHANLASVYGRQGDITAAVAELELALKHDPCNLLALTNLGYAYAQQGRRDEARELLQRALAVNPSQPQAQHLLERLR